MRARSEQERAIRSSIDTLESLRKETTIFDQDQEAWQRRSQRVLDGTVLLRV